MSDLTVPIYFFWQQASADPRQYNQQRTLLLPDVAVAVDVPLKATYVYNAEEIIKAQLSAEEAVAPILTPLGMAYCDDQLVNAYRADASEGVPEGDIDWEDDEKVVLENLEDDDEFPVEETIDEDEDLSEILWEN